MEGLSAIVIPRGQAGRAPLYRTAIPLSSRFRCALACWLSCFETFIYGLSAPCQDHGRDILLHCHCSYHRHGARSARARRGAARPALATAFSRGFQHCSATVIRRVDDSDVQSHGNCALRAWTSPLRQFQIAQTLVNIYAKVPPNARDAQPRSHPDLRPCPVRSCGWKWRVEGHSMG